MMENLAIGAAATIALAVGWYCCFRRLNRRRSVCILSWIEQAFSGHGSVGSIHWDNASCFRVELRLFPKIFRQTWLAVRLQPSETPLGWLLSRIHGRQETVTFEAELDAHPGFSLHVRKRHWLVRNGPISRKPLDDWHLRGLDPMVLSTQADCQNQVGNMLDTLLAARSSRFFNVVCRKQAPQLIACAPLRSLSPEERGAEIFDMLQALATRASTSAQ